MPLPHYALRRISATPPRRGRLTLYHFDELLRMPRDIEENSSATPTVRRRLLLPESEGP